MLHVQCFLPLYQSNISGGCVYSICYMSSVFYHCTSLTFQVDVFIVSAICIVFSTTVSSLTFQVDVFIVSARCLVFSTTVSVQHLRWMSTCLMLRWMSLYSIVSAGCLVVSTTVSLMFFDLTFCHLPNIQLLCVMLLQMMCILHFGDSSGVLLCRLVSGATRGTGAHKYLHLTHNTCDPCLGSCLFHPPQHISCLHFAVRAPWWRYLVLLSAGKRCNQGDCGLRWLQCSSLITGEKGVRGKSFTTAE